MMGRRRRDDYPLSMIVLSALAAVGLVSIAVAWRGLAASLSVSVQIPYAVSGVMGGVALLGFALGLLSVQASRRAAAVERADMDRLVNASAELLADVRAGM